jgi:hypothetical protein
MEAQRIMNGLEDGKGIGAKARRSQVAMAKVNAEMWGNVHDATKVGIGDAVWNAKEMQSLFDESLFKAAGVDSKFWRASMIAQAQEGVNSLIARKENGLTLSDKVYRNQALSKGYVDRAINNGLLLGKSAKEIADDVVKFINPNVPGGASYSAMRLGRTEVNNAFHASSLKGYKDTPWINTVQWHMSSSHARPDECNEYAESTHFKGGGPGVFKTGDVPSKPHPQCLCYIEGLSDDLDKFAKNFKSGKYDNYINQKMGCART